MVSLMSHRGDCDSMDAGCLGMHGARHEGAYNLFVSLYMLDAGAFLSERSMSIVSRMLRRAAFENEEWHDGAHLSQFSWRMLLQCVHQPRTHNQESENCVGVFLRYRSSSNKFSASLWRTETSVGGVRAHPTMRTLWRYSPWFFPQVPVRKWFRTITGCFPQAIVGRPDIAASYRSTCVDPQLMCFRASCSRRGWSRHLQPLHRWSLQLLSYPDITTLKFLHCVGVCDPVWHFDCKAGKLTSVGARAWRN